MPLSLAPVLVLFLAAAASPAAPASIQGTAGQVTLKDRVVAIVDEDPILGSDIDRVIGLGLAPAKPGESDHDFRRRVLGELIDQRLRFHEIDRFGLGQVPAAQGAQNVKEIRDRFKPEAELNQRLKEVGLTLAGLRQLATRQLMVLTYVDERLG